MIFLKSFYIDEASTENNYGIYESLITNDIKHHESIGIINSKNYYYQYNTNILKNSNIANYDFKFSIGKEQINILATDYNKEINKFNMEVIINMLNEVYSYNKEKDNKMYVFVPGNFFIDSKHRLSNDILSLINECQIKYSSMLEINEETI